ncbi:MAG: hypothetical protein B6A08_16460 [Sorangiineae bacterium NIC37A_2]|jgi:two-component system NtrC family sensor kinase|nr:MAG: hypothetical protein B6A08_16460 [Sorangiineae bacterium NIC37A_2]
MGFSDFLSARSRSLVSRIVVSYLIVLLGFVWVSGMALFSLRSATRETRVLSQEYLPLALSVRDLVLNQDTWNSQLNHVTETDNPAAKRAWYETELRLGRTQKLAEVEAHLASALGQGDRISASEFEALARELTHIRELISFDGQEVAELFAALERDDGAGAEAARDALVLRGLRVSRALARFEKQISDYVDGLVRAAEERERVALILLSVCALVALLVGILMALYARRAVLPITWVKKRAEAVLLGDLSPKPVVETGDEVGELSSTFEAMVRAIAATREQLLASERLVTIGKLAAHVTHEVRNPLSSIALNLELLGDELGPGPSEARSLLAAIGAEVDRLSALSNQYLSMARRTAPELTDTDLGEVVLGAAEFMRRDLTRSGHQLEVTIEEGLPWVPADAGQIRQALYNLVRNAREATPPGQLVSIRLGRRDNLLVLSVEDEGPGIDPGQMERLFDPFFTTKEHGTGLGLAVTRQIAEVHHGRLRYERREEGGSRFLLEIPIPEAKSEPEP